MTESSWEQSFTGDYTDERSKCPPGYSPPCPTSFGLTQLKWVYMPGSYPWSLRSSAFNLDYALARLRACFEGHVTFFAGDYAPGVMWGCVGAHYSGDWKSAAAFGYVGRVRHAPAERSWLDLWPDQRLEASARRGQAGRGSPSTTRRTDDG